MYLLIAGDLVIDNSFGSIEVEDHLISMFRDAVCSIINLECPITKSGVSQKINKTGPHLKGDLIGLRKIIRLLGINTLTLANNHIMDYGADGLYDTISFCDENNLSYVGVGSNLRDAEKHLIVNFCGLNIAIINIAENEWSSATLDSPGAAPLNSVANYYAIRKAKTVADKVFVIIHGGHEYYDLPNPSTRDLYRFFVDAGADLVVAHHTHCISGMEIYKNAPIYYGLGNFLFTHDSPYNSWYQGLVLKVSLNNNKSLKFDVLPTVFEKGKFNLSFAKGSEKEQIINHFNKLGAIIESDELLNQYWCDYTKARTESYLFNLSPIGFINNRVMRGIARRTKLYKIFLNKKGASTLLNLMRCEAHSFLAKTILANYLRQ